MGLLRLPMGLIRPASGAPGSNIAFVTATSFATTGGTLPAGPVGELIIGGGCHTAGTATIPALPGGEGWVGMADDANLDPTHANSVLAGRADYMITDEADEGSSGTFTDAATVVFTRYSGINVTTPILSCKWSSGTSGDPTVPALTNLNSTSWVGFMYRFQNAVTITSSPSGFTERISGTRRGTFDSNGVVSSYTGETLTVSGAAGRWIVCAYGIASS